LVVLFLIALLLFLDAVAITYVAVNGT